MAEHQTPAGAEAHLLPCDPVMPKTMMAAENEISAVHGSFLHCSAMNIKKSTILAANLACSCCQNMYVVIAHQNKINAQTCEHHEEPTFAFVDNAKDSDW
jgi:hypothetical protein